MKDLLIIEVAEGIAGPICGLQFADLGARVLKVETPDGDRSRGWGGVFIDGESAAFLALNRSKESVVVDPESEPARASLIALVEQGDVLIEHIRPLTKSWASLIGAEPCEINPKLVHVRISANGVGGPLSDRPGSELTAQAMSGYWKLLGAPDAAPVRHGAELAEIGTGLFAYQGAMAALLHRRRTQQGQAVDLSLLGSLMTYATILTASMNKPDDWVGFHLLNILWAPDTGYHTSDGKVTLEFRRGRKLWVDFCEQVGLGHLPDDPRFRDWRATIYTGDLVGETKEEYDRALSTLPSSVVLDAVAGVGGTSVPHSTMASIGVHPQAQSVGAFTAAPLPQSGTMRQVASPFTVELPDGSGEIRPAPRLGQHTDQWMQAIAERGGRRAAR